MPSCWNGRRCLVIPCVSSLPSISAFICSPVCPERLAPADSFPGFPAGCLLLGWLMGDTSRRWGLEGEQCGSFRPSPSGSVPHDSGRHSSSSHGLWFILDGPFSPGGGRLCCLSLDTSPSIVASSTLCMFPEVMSTESLHSYPTSVTCQGLGWLTGVLALTSLLSFMRALLLGGCFYPLHLLLKPSGHRLFSLNLFRTHWSSLANKGYLGSSRHSDPHWISSTSFIPSFWLKLWTAQHLFLTPWHSQNLLISAWRVLSSTYPTCSFFFF